MGFSDASSRNVKEKREKLITDLLRFFIVSRYGKFTVSKNSVYKIKKNYVETKKEENLTYVKTNVG